MSAKSLREKTQGIRFDEVDDPVRPLSSSTDRPRTGPGAVSASLALGRGVVEDHERLKVRVQELEEAGLIELLDAETIGPSKYANRLEESFRTPEFAELKDEIEAAGGNVQPIKVRKLAVPRGKIQYEIVFGHRRHRACLVLGFKVRVIVDPVGDLELVTQMERENRGRENLSPWEQGVFYRKLIDEKLFPSIRRLADQLGVDHGLVSKAIQLASLPEPIVAAFPSPLALQFRWGALIQDAITRDEPRVLAVASELVGAPAKLGAKEVLERLVSSPATLIAAKPVEFQTDGKVVGSWEKDRRGGHTLRLKAGALTATNERKLVEYIEKLIS
jgi:ParB family chromosome partitioning protein